MNKIVWRIAEEAFEDKQDSLIPVLDRLDIDHVVYKFDKVHRTYESVQSIKSDVSIFYGPINFIRNANANFSNISLNSGYKLFYGWKNVNCIDYYGYYPNKWLLNGDMNFVPFGTLWDRIEDILMRSNGIFIRPNSSRKSFTGLELNESNYVRELRFLSENLHVDNNELIGYCSKKKIEKEFRFWIVDRKVVAWFGYSWDENFIPSEPDVLTKNFAEQVAKHPWNPDDVYTVDIGTTLYGPKIVELNSFCSAGMYNADQEKIIKSVHDYTCTLF